jgi:hypothetical protein
MVIATAHIKNQAPTCSRATSTWKGASKILRPADVRAKGVAFFLMRSAVADPQGHSTRHGTGVAVLVESGHRNRAVFCSI